MFSRPLTEDEARLIERIADFVRKMDLYTSQDAVLRLGRRFRRIVWKRS